MESLLNSGNDEGNSNDTEEQQRVPENLPESPIKMTGDWVALFNFLKGSIGAGILTLPGAFKYCGLYMGLVLLTFISILSTYLMHVLLRTAEDVIIKNNLDRTKIDYAEAVFNVLKYGPERLRRHIIETFVIFTQIGVCCIYILFASQNIKYTVWPGTHANLYLIGFIVTCLIVVMNIKVTLRVFAIPAAIAMGATFTGLGLIFVYMFTTGLKDPELLPHYTTFNNTLIGFGVFVYTFEGISLTLPIRNHMKFPERFVAPFGTLNTTMVIVTCMCVLQGFFGYLCFGDDILGSITYNIPNEPRIYMAIKPLFVFAILISYMLQFYVPCIIFGRLMLKIRRHREASAARQSVNRKLLRVCAIFFTYGVAMVVPHLDLMVALLGSFAGSTLALITPPVLEVIQLWPQRDQIPWFYLKVVAKHAIIFAFGLMVALCAGTATIWQIIQVVRSENGAAGGFD